MNNLSDYPFEIRPLSIEEGGGVLILSPPARLQGRFTNR